MGHPSSYVFFQKASINPVSTLDWIRSRNPMIKDFFTTSIERSISPSGRAVTDEMAATSPQT